jgi:hypothetical protein
MNAQIPAPRTWSDLDEYLKPAHLAGKTIQATIERIEFRTLHPRPGVEEIKPVLYFAGKNKSLILTSTNQTWLRSTYGDEITASYNHVVTLHAVTKHIAGRDIDTIILGQPATQSQPAAPAAGK